MVPEVASQAGIDPTDAHQAKVALDIETDAFLKWKPVAPATEVLVMRPKLIGLTGKARSGKDTVASIIKKSHFVHTISFAEPIRKALRGMMGLNEEHFHGSLKEVPLGWIDKSPRQLMQTLGTQWGRELVDDEIWIKLAKRDIELHLRCGIDVVVTDVRFDNEAAMIREMGGTIWHIERQTAQAVNAHASEAGIEYKLLEDCVIYNNFSLETLANSVNEMWDASRRIE